MKINKTNIVCWIIIIVNLSKMNNDNNNQADVLSTYFKFTLFIIHFIVDIGEEQEDSNYVSQADRYRYIVLTFILYLNLILFIW